MLLGSINILDPFGVVWVAQYGLKLMTRFKVISNAHCSNIGGRFLMENYEKSEKKHCVVLDVRTELLF